MALLLLQRVTVVREFRQKEQGDYINCFSYDCQQVNRYSSGKDQQSNTEIDA